MSRGWRKADGQKPCAVSPGPLSTGTRHNVRKHASHRSRASLWEILLVETEPGEAPRRRADRRRIGQSSRRGGSCAAFYMHSAPRLRRGLRREGACQPVEFRARVHTALGYRCRGRRNVGETSPTDPSPCVHRCHADGMSSASIHRLHQHPPPTSTKSPHARRWWYRFRYKYTRAAVGGKSASPLRRPFLYARPRKHAGGAGHRKV